MIDWTARAAVACFIVRQLLMLRRSDRTVSRSEFAVWTIGWLLLAAHTTAAFQLQHGWSHAAAYAHTARRTRETVGWDWGGGLYFNYLTLALWGADVVAVLWGRLRRIELPRWWTRMVVGWIGFIVVNATLVFGPRWWWAIGVLGLVSAFVPLSPVKSFDSSSTVTRGRGPG